MTGTLADAFAIMSPKQLASIHWAPRRKLALWVGAVSAGKTVASLLAFLFALLDAPKGGLVVIIGKTLQSIEDNVISTLQNPELFGELAEHTIHTKGSNFAIILGRRVTLIGANNASAEERIRGATYALAYVDEATIIPPNFWSMLVTRLRLPGSRLLATTNPGSRNHWLKRDWIDRGDAVDMITFHLTMLDNPSLEPAYIDLMQRTYADPILHARFILGLWTAAEGAVYSEFDTTLKPLADHTAHVIPWAETPELQKVLCIGMDWGTTNASTGLLLGVTAERQLVERPNQSPVWMPRPRLILLDEWVYNSRVTKRQLTPDQQVDLFAPWYNGPAGFFAAHTPKPIAFDRPQAGLIVDPAAPAFSTALRNAGFLVSPAANSVGKGIGVVSNLIASHHLLVTDRCVGFLSEISEYVWDQKKSDEKGLDEPAEGQADHSLDAARYAIYTSRPLWLPVLQRAYDLAA